MQKIESHCLTILLIFIGTGLHAQFPSFAYIPVVMAIAVLFFDYKFWQQPFKYIEKSMIFGVLLFNAFLCLQIIIYRLDPKSYFFQFFSVNLMILIYAHTKLILTRKPDNITSLYKYLCLLLIFCLLTLILGQIAEITGYIQRTNFEGADELFFITQARPGGFLNPNSTAVIAVVLLYTLERLSKVLGRSYILIGLPIGMAVVLLSQSRTAILVLFIFLGLLLRQPSSRNIATILITLLVPVSAIYIFYPVEADIMITNIFERFMGDSSSDERRNVLLHSFSSIGESPVWGSGSAYLIRSFGASSHNQLIEILVSYGAVGLLTIGTAFFLLYLPVSISFFVCCLLPMLLFSHNFFDSYSYQVVLGLALAINRHVSSAVLSKSH